MFIPLSTVSTVLIHILWDKYNEGLFYLEYILPFEVVYVFFPEQSLEISSHVLL